MHNSTLASRLRELRSQHGITQVDLSKVLNVHRGTLANWEIGRSFPDPTTLCKIAEHFRVSIDFLVGRTNSPYGTYMPPGVIVPDRLVRVPVLGVIRAGLPIYADENVLDWELVPEKDVSNGDFFLLRVTGDSMIGARIQDGDFVMVHKQDYAESGDVVVVMVNHEEATLKRIILAGDSIVLKADNPKYRPLVFTGPERDAVHILGKVLWLKAAIE